MIEDSEYSMITHKATIMGSTQILISLDILIR